MRYSLASTLTAINRMTVIAPLEPVAEVFLASVLASFDPAAERPRLLIVGPDAKLLVDLLAGWGPVERVPSFRWQTTERHRVDGPGYVVNDRGWFIGSRVAASATKQHFDVYRWDANDFDSRGYDDRYTVARSSVIAFLDERIAMLRDVQSLPFAGYRDVRVLTLCEIALSVAGTNADFMHLASAATDLAQYLAFIRDVPTFTATDAEYQIAFRFILSQLSRIDGRILHVLISNGGEAMNVTEIAHACGLDRDIVRIAIRQRLRTSGVLRCAKRGIYALRSDLRSRTVAVGLEPLRVDTKAARSVIETRGLVV
jgi:hypothetical protein